MTRPCNVCNHPNRTDIDRQLVTGKSAAEVARQYGLAARTLQRHATKHLPATLKAAVEKDEEARELNVLEEVKDLHRRTMTLLTGNEDAPKVALAAIREARGNLELLGKLLGQLDERPQVNVLVSPQWVEVRTAILKALLPFPEAREAVAHALMEVNEG